jgi:hypothetical protein
VLTSQLRSSPRPYHIPPERWVGDLTALRRLVDSRRNNIKIVRYEYLVRPPVESQNKVGHFFSMLKINLLKRIYIMRTADVAWIDSLRSVARPVFSLMPDVITAPRARPSK